MSATFSLRKTYYAQPTYAFNLPAGHTCPFAKVCKVEVDEATGKFNNSSSDFRCYASAAERFPNVRASRWNNYRAVLGGERVVVPKKATHVRIHESGDFFSQEYFDMWLEICRSRPDVQFWAFTKSVPYWIARLGEIPDNLTLQASVGSTVDHLITEHGLKYAQVFKSAAEVPSNMGDRAKQHGTYLEYSNYGCRCEACKDAAREYRRDYNRRRREGQVAWQPDRPFEERRAEALANMARVSCGDPSAERYLRGCRCEDCCYVMASYQKRLRR